MKYDAKAPDCICNYRRLVVRNREYGGIKQAKIYGRANQKIPDVKAIDDIGDSTETIFAEIAVR